MMPVVLYVRGEAGYEVLRRLISRSRFLIQFVVVARDADLEKDFFRESCALAESAGVTWYQNGSHAKVHYNTYVIAVSWRWMIAHPNDRLLIFHDSLLPRYRGFSPLPNMLINGETEIGVTLLLGHEKYDRGPLVLQSKSEISYPIKIAAAIKLNIANYLKIADQIVDILLSGDTISGVAQNEALATYSIWRDQDDYRINWTDEAGYIKRFIDSVGPPYKGAYSIISDSDVLRVGDAQVVDDLVCEHRHVGKVIEQQDGKPVIICGKGLLRLNEFFLESPSGPRAWNLRERFRVRLR